MDPPPKQYREMLVRSAHKLCKRKRTRTLLSLGLLLAINVRCLKFPLNAIVEHDTAPCNIAIEACTKQR